MGKVDNVGYKHLFSFANNVSKAFSSGFLRINMILDEKGEDVSKYEGLTLLKIAEEYPGDIGALAVYFLNEIALQPGEALFIEVNEPHAYLEGGKLESFPFGG